MRIINSDLKESIKCHRRRLALATFKSSYLYVKVDLREEATGKGRKASRDREMEGKSSEEGSSREKSY